MTKIIEDIGRWTELQRRIEDNEAAIETHQEAIGKRIDIIQRYESEMKTLENEIVAKFVREADC